MADTATPPTPDGVPLLGNGMAFSRDPFRALEGWATLGDVVRLSFPGQTTHLVTSPDLIKEVLVERQDSFTISRQQREVFSDVEDDAVTGTTGERWKRLRRALQPAFTVDQITNYGSRMARRTARHVEEWEVEPLDLHREMRLLTVRILGDTLLGVDIEGDETVLMDAADALIARSDARRLGRLLPDWVPTPTERRFKRRIAALDAYVENVLDDRSRGGDDVRSVLLAAQDRGDLSMREVKDNLVAVLLGGHDSSAVTLTYVWHALSRNPTIVESLLEEVDETCAGGLPAADDVRSLKWTRAIVDETLRLYPPAWATPRETTEAVTLGGYELQAGTQLMCPQWVLHRDERFWDDPETFDPGRWMEETDRPEYAYFPFSGGPRHCIGMRFARLELMLVVATMAQRVTLDVTTGGPLNFRPALSLRPTVDIEATVRHREPRP